MSSTIKQAILSLKSRIADAYTAIAAKGGTMPATQDSSSLPAAIESIPGIEEYDIISGIMLSDDPSDPSVPTRPLPDGLSLVHLLCEPAILKSVVELKDANSGWDAFGISFPISLFPNATKYTIGCKSIEQNAAGRSTFINKTLDELNAPYLEYIGVKRDSSYTYKYYYQNIAETINSEVVELPSLKRIFNTSSDGTSHWSYGAPALGILPNCKRLLVPELSDIRTSCSAWSGKGTGTQCLANAPECLELITAIEGDTNANNASADYKFIVSPKLRKFIIGGVLTTRNDKGLFNTTSTDLVHLEIGGATCSLFMNNWSPTNALDASRTDLIEEGSTAENNLQQFLLNFRDYIALRLADRTGSTALTLTLSAAVYGALTSDTRSLADLGITADDLTAAETAAGITTATAYNSWLDTYRAAINWNYAQA